MKTLKVLINLFIFILFSFHSYATDYYWVGGASGNFNTNTNWEDINGNNPSMLSSTDNIIFNTGENVTVDVGFANGFSNLTINNNSIVNFISLGSNVFLNCDTIVIEINSGFQINDNSNIVNINFKSGEINGFINLSNNPHTFAFVGNSGESINFKSGSSFSYDSNTTSSSSPFDGGGSYYGIIFEDGSDYLHYSGNSPFKGGDFVEFQQGSNYYILGDTNIEVLFAGHTYGNIIIGDSESSQINVDFSETTTGTFSFYNLTTENGTLTYDDGIASIEINNGTIDANGGIIWLTAERYEFIGDCAISSDNTTNYIRFNDNSSSYTLINATSSLTLDGRLSINNLGDINIDGTINFKTNQITLMNTSYSYIFSNTAKLITANAEGVDGSFALTTNYSLSSETTIEYNSNIESQNIGLPDGYTVGNLIVNNPENIKMQYDLIIVSLFLDQGNLQIEDNNLIIQKNIDYNGGHLFGGNTSNLSFVNDVANVLLDQDLTLNSLTIDGINTAVSLDDGDETGLNYLNIDNGSMNLNNNSLRINNEVNLNGGQLDIFGGTLKIGGTITVATAAMLIGGSNSNLEFLSTAENAVLPINELSNLLIQTPNEITLGDNLTIQNFLGIENGILSISNYELVLNGGYQTGGYLKGNINSDLIIEGAPQNLDITFFNNSEFNSLQIDRANSIITITNPITIYDNLELTNGNIRTVNELTIGNSCSLNYNNNSYIEIGGVGSVSKYISDSEDFEFPIGTENGYSPITISPNTSENFTVSVIEDVFENGYDGSIFTDDRIINLTWDISSASSNYNLKLNWFDEVVGANFDQNNSYVSFFNTSTNLWEQITLATTNDIINEITVDGISQTGKFYVSSIYNMAPIVENQRFEIMEHSTIGTIVGQIEATDPDFNNISFSFQDIDTNLDAFNIDENGQITVRNSEIMEFSNQSIYKYLVTVCDDGIPTAECSEAEITIDVTEFNIEELYITNYISPNGDGVNDTWIVNGPSDITYIAKIYDKNGNLVFETDNYQNNWAGTNYGTPLPSGVYYYHLTALMVDVQPSYKGTITIIK